MAEAIALVIDDDERIHVEVERALIPHQCARVLHAHSPGDGIRVALDSLPDLILLDVNMPGIDGIKVCRLLKDHAATRDIPVIFITVDRKVEHLAQALDCGAVDYIAKPFNQVELRARVRVALRGKQILDLLKEQARVDGLTGLRNRMALDDGLLAAASAYERTGAPVSLMMLDVDHFKAINDEHGHGVGDEVLRSLGQAIRGCCRPYDLASRFGGDEFVVLFGQIEGVDAHSAARRLLSELKRIQVTVASGDALVITVSAGLVSTAEWSGGFEPDDLLKAADAALYRAKQAGRDRLEFPQGEGR